MNPERWARIEAILDDALGKPPAEQAAILEAACAGDADLRREVEELLAAEAPAFLDGDATNLVAEEIDGLVGPAIEAELDPGASIGPWRVVRPVGSGGMSRVYLCEPAAGPVDRRVAVKVMDVRGHDPEETRRRFRAEGQILATLDHRFIARAFDSDVTADGRSYLVMEHVEGARLTDHCDEARLGLSRRLRLFEDVCEAVQYAHQRLVVHRDLKPSNILVTRDGEVKLLDFGIAKLLDPETWELSQGAPLTRAGVALLTPEYAAPEQIRREAVTTAADVYSLGVILYELMTGLRPHRVAPGASLAEVERVVLREPPRTPSSALAAAPKAERAAHPWSADLRGDLDTIALKALRLDPEDRYASVAEMAEDLRAWRSHLPIKARPPSLPYRAGKFIRRNRLPTILFAIGLVIMSGFAWALAEKQAATVAELGRAQAEAERASEVTDFVLGLFEASRPDESLGRSVTAAEILGNGVRLAGAMEDKPIARAQMLDTLGRAWTKLGQPELGEPLLLQAFDIRKESLGESHGETLSTALALAELYDAWGRPAESERYRSLIASPAR